MAKYTCRFCGTTSDLNDSEYRYCTRCGRYEDSVASEAARVLEGERVRGLLQGMREGDLEIREGEEEQ